jgi:molybdate transport system substrate-binding protein
VRRIAIANPERAPYGVAAQEAMKAVGVMESLEGRLILGESVAQAFQYAETGNADVALVPLSLTIGKSGEAQLVPDSLHRPIVQAIGAVSASPHPVNARAFVDFVTGPAGREILSRYGYDLPQGEPTP